MDAGSESGALSAEACAARQQAFAAAAVAALLDLGARVDRFSNWLAVLGLAVLATGVFYLPGGDNFDARAWAAVVVLGLVQKYFALRVGLDARLFALLSRGFEGEGAATVLADFDRGMHAAGLIKAPGEPARSLASRSQGARRLLRLQIACMLVQCLLFLYLAAVAASVVPSGGDGETVHELNWRPRAAALHAEPGHVA
ncbi:MAG: hypothetical protein KF778_10815 [Rhodocyclaceae bacterium]|nr:hypothetical protein [Rhodocyclaceae bacterium]MBX3668884.1 hypothetical protein [Rhodocyclaceae bacterium]